MDCSTCERRNKKGEGCQVFKTKPKQCWAWTDDKEWSVKVEKDIAKYALRIKKR